MAATEHLLLSLPRAGAPEPLGARDIARIVGRHAEAAEPLRIDAPHTCCAVDERQRHRRGISRAAR